MYLELFLMLVNVAVFVALVEESGFWDSLDGFINSRFKFHHLPHIFMCSLCQTWWICFIYIIATGNLTLFNMVICLLVANLPPFIRAIFKTITGMIWKIINILNNKIVK